MLLPFHLNGAVRLLPCWISVAMLLWTFLPTRVVAQYYDNEINARVVKGHSNRGHDETNNRNILFNNNKIVNGHFDSMYIRYHGCIPTEVSAKDDDDDIVDSIEEATVGSVRVAFSLYSVKQGSYHLRSSQTTCNRRRTILQKSILLIDYATIAENLQSIGSMTNQSSLYAVNKRYNNTCHQGYSVGCSLSNQIVYNRYSDELCQRFNDTIDTMLDINAALEALDCLEITSNSTMRQLLLHSHKFHHSNQRIDRLLSRKDGELKKNYSVVETMDVTMTTLMLAMTIVLGTGLVLLLRPDQVKNAQSRRKNNSVHSLPCHHSQDSKRNICDQQSTEKLKIISLAKTHDRECDFKKEQTIGKKLLGCHEKQHIMKESKSTFLESRDNTYSSRREPSPGRNDKHRPVFAIATGGRFERLPVIDVLDASLEGSKFVQLTDKDDIDMEESESQQEIGRMETRSSLGCTEKASNEQAYGVPVRKHMKRHYDIHKNGKLVEKSAFYPRRTTESHIDFNGLAVLDFPNIHDAVAEKYPNHDDKAHEVSREKLALEDQEVFLDWQRDDNSVLSSVPETLKSDWKANSQVCAFLDALEEYIDGNSVNMDRSYLFATMSDDDTYSTLGGQPEHSPLCHEELTTLKAANCAMKSFSNSCQATTSLFTPLSQEYQDNTMFQAADNASSASLVRGPRLWVNKTIGFLISPLTHRTSGKDRLQPKQTARNSELPSLSSSKTEENDTCIGAHLRQHFPQDTSSMDKQPTRNASLHSNSKKLSVDSTKQCTKEGIVLDCSSQSSDKEIFTTCLSHLRPRGRAFRCEGETLRSEVEKACQTFRSNISYDFMSQVSPIIETYYPTSQPTLSNCIAVINDAAKMNSLLETFRTCLDNDRICHQGTISKRPNEEETFRSNHKNCPSEACQQESTCMDNAARKIGCSETQENVELILTCGGEIIKGASNNKGGNESDTRKVSKVDNATKCLVGTGQCDRLRVLANNETPEQSLGNPQICCSQKSASHYSSSMTYHGQSQKIFQGEPITTVNRSTTGNRSDNESTMQSVEVKYLNNANMITNNDVKSYVRDFDCQISSANILEDLTYNTDGTKYGSDALTNYLDSHAHLEDIDLYSTITNDESTIVNVYADHFSPFKGNAACCTFISHAAESKAENDVEDNLSSNSSRKTSTTNLVSAESSPVARSWSRKDCRNSVPSMESLARSTRQVNREIINTMSGVVDSTSKDATLTNAEQSSKGVSRKSSKETTMATVHHDDKDDNISTNPSCLMPGHHTISQNRSLVDDFEKAELTLAEYNAMFRSDRSLKTRSNASFCDPKWSEEAATDRRLDALFQTTDTTGTQPMVNLAPSCQDELPLNQSESFADAIHAKVQSLSVDGSVHSAAGNGFFVHHFSECEQFAIVNSKEVSLVEYSEALSYAPFSGRFVGVESNNTTSSDGVSAYEKTDRRDPSSTQSTTIVSEETQDGDEEVVAFELFLDGSVFAARRSEIGFTESSRKAAVLHPDQSIVNDDHTGPVKLALENKNQKHCYAESALKPIPLLECLSIDRGIFTADSSAFVSAAESSRSSCTTNPAQDFQSNSIGITAANGSGSLPRACSVKQFLDSRRMP